MVVFLSGGTGTPKLLAGADDVFPPDETCVVANTGDDVEIGGNLVCPDLDTVLFLDGGVLDRERWWGIEGDSHRTHSRLQEVASAAGLDPGPRYLPDSEQTSGRRISRWRRFSGVAEFMTIGDRDRAVHITRTGLLDEGHSLTDATRRLADAYSLERELLPMSDDPVATLVHTDEDVVHFQEWWVHGRGEATPRAVEFRGIEDARPSLAVRQRLDGEEPVVVGPSNPVTSIGPVLALPGVEDALYERPVVAVSPFVEDRVFSGPAADLMEMAGHAPSTSGVADTFPFVDAFVLDDADGTDLDRPVVRTDTGMSSDADSERVAAACRRALEEVGA